jgi:hypothetical protein
MKKVNIDSIRIDGGTQGRSVVDQPTVYNYLEDMKGGDVFPRMFAVFDGATYWLVDGFHRYHAYKLLGIKEIEIDYKPGTQEEAQVMSFGVNSKHGKPRSNEDKRKVVLLALEHPLTKHKSDNEIAKICCVSNPFVAAVRNPEAKERQEQNRIKSMKKKMGIESGDAPQAEQASRPDSIPEPAVNHLAGEAPDEAELKAAELALQADQEMFYKLLDSDEALKTAYDEIKRLNHQNAQLEIRLHGLMNERNEAVKMVKSLQKQVDKMKAKK